MSIELEIHLDAISMSFQDLDERIVACDQNPIGVDQGSDDVAAGEFVE